MVGAREAASEHLKFAPHLRGYSSALLFRELQMNGHAWFGKILTIHLPPAFETELPGLQTAVS